MEIHLPLLTKVRGANSQEDKSKKPHVGALYLVDAAYPPLLQISLFLDAAALHEIVGPASRRKDPFPHPAHSFLLPNGMVSACRIAFDLILVVGLMISAS